MTPREWELAGLTDEEGKLKSYLKGISFTFVPPSVGIKKGRKGLSVVFPVPAEWRETKPEEWYYRHRASWWRDLERSGWKLKEGLRGVANEFVRLSVASETEVLSFTEKWGPLWACGEHVECFLSTIFSPWLVPNMGPCWWSGFEPVNLFKWHARKVRAVLDISAALIEGKSASPTLWEEVGLEGEVSRARIEYQRYILAGIVNEMLDMLGIGFMLDWNGTKPGLAIGIRMGFLPAVWLEVAQSVARARQIYICDSCQEVYIRYGRKPQAGRKNYCPRCRSQNAKQKAYVEKLKLEALLKNSPT